MTPPGWKPWPKTVAEIVALAVAEVSCRTCGAAPGKPCVDPGEGRDVHGGRWAVAAMTRRRRKQAARLTPEQQAVLASPPHVPPGEIEKCRLPGGGYRFTPSWFLEHGLPYPPPAGWRKAIEGSDP